MPVNGFNVEDLRFELKDPKSIKDDTRWKALRELAERGFLASLPDRSLYEVSNLLSSKSVDAFRESRQKPTKAARNSDHMRPSWFYSPTMAIAYDGDAPIGYAYAAHNVSGGIVEAAAKRFIARSFINFRELVVDPDYQGNGIAETLGFLSLSQQGEGLHTTAYVFDESVGVGASLIGLGFDEYTDPETGYDHPEEVLAFGNDSAPAMMRRYEGGISMVKAHILSRPGAKFAIEHALVSAKLRD